MLTDTTRFKIRTDEETMTREELAYLAGVIDGEGTISVTSDRACGSLFACYLSIGNTSYELISRIKDWIGSGSFQEKKVKKNYYKPYYVFTLRGDKLRSLLPQIQEFLVVKKPQAKLLGELLSLTGQHLKFYQRLHPDMFKTCQRLSLELHQLNQKTNKLKETKI